MAYTLSSPRAALLLRHEATTDCRFQAALRELRQSQSTRQNEPTTPRSPRLVAAALAALGPAEPISARSNMPFPPNEAVRHEGAPIE